MRKIELAYQGRSQFKLYIDGQEMTDVRSFSYHAGVGELPRTGRRTAALLDDDIDIEWLDEVMVKGKSDPVRPCILRRAAH